MRKGKQMQPDLTYYHGQTVASVDEIDDGYEVVLETGVKIVVSGEESPGNALVGKAFMKTIMDSGMTKLYFGTDDNPLSTVMHLDPTSYAISDPNFEDGRLVFPQSTEEERDAAFAPAAPGERVVEGPSEEWDEEEGQ